MREWFHRPRLKRFCDGHKAEAKRLMIDEGVACIPGYQGADQSEARRPRKQEASATR